MEAPWRFCVTIDLLMQSLEYLTIFVVYGISEQLPESTRDSWN